MNQPPQTHPWNHQPRLFLRRAQPPHAHRRSQQPRTGHPPRRPRPRRQQTRIPHPTRQPRLFLRRTQPPEAHRRDRQLQLLHPSRSPTHPRPRSRRLRRPRPTLPPRLQGPRRRQTPLPHPTHSRPRSRRLCVHHRPRPPRGPGGRFDEMAPLPRRARRWSRGHQPTSRRLVSVPPGCCCRRAPAAVRPGAGPPTVRAATPETCSPGRRSCPCATERPPVDRPPRWGRVELRLGPAWVRYRESATPETDPPSTFHRPVLIPGRHRARSSRLRVTLPRYRPCPWCPPAATPTSPDTPARARLLAPASRLWFVVQAQARRGACEEIRPYARLGPAVLHRVAE
jgi:hypothetical protein